MTSMMPMAHTRLTVRRVLSIRRRGGSDPVVSGGASSMGAGVSTGSIMPGHGRSGHWSRAAVGPIGDPRRRGATASVRAS